jgi:hypothetical protein
MKSHYLLISVLFAGSAILYAQTSQTVRSEIDKKLQNAPAIIRKHYSTLDSLVDLGQRRWVNESWTDSEVKRYASLLYDVYEHDPVLRHQHEYDPERVKRYEHKGWLIDDRAIFKEAEKILPRSETRLIKTPFWLGIMVDSLITRPFAGAAYFTEKRVFGTIVEVWKGPKYKPGQKIEAYYLTAWGRAGFEIGKEFLVGLTPVAIDSEKQIYDLAIGGSLSFSEHVFPVEGTSVVDNNNFFNLGNRVELKSFSNFLSSEIAKIKSWKWGADR